MMKVITIEDYGDYGVGDSISGWTITNGIFTKSADSLAYIESGSAETLSIKKEYSTPLYLNSIYFEVEPSDVDFALSVLINGVELVDATLSPSSQTITASFDVQLVNDIEITLYDEAGGSASADIYTIYATGVRSYGRSIHDYDPDDLILGEYK